MRSLLRIFIIVISVFSLFLLSSCISSKEVKKKDEKKELKSDKNKKQQADDENSGEKKKDDDEEKEENDEIKLSDDNKKVENIVRKEEKKVEEEKTFDVKDKEKINSELIPLKNSKPEELVVKIDELLKEYPESDLLYYHKARAYYLANDFDNAMFNLEKSLKLNPKNLNSLWLKFEILFKKDKKEAEKYLLSLLRDNPDDYKVILVVDKGYYKLGRYKKVIYLSKEVLKLNQNNKEALKFLALGYYYTDSLDLAFYVITKVDDLMYQIPELSFIKGLIFYKNKNMKAAHDAFSEAFELSPDFFEAGDWLAYIDYKVSLRIKNEEDKKKTLLKAKENYEKVIKLRKAPLTYMNYALVLYELNENDEALKYFLESEKLDDKNYMLYYNLGILYLEKKLGSIDDLTRYDLAVKAFETYNKLLPKKDFKKLNANNLIAEAKTLKAVEQAKISAEQEEKAKVDEEDKEEDKEESVKNGELNENEDKEESDKEINKTSDEENKVLEEDKKEEEEDKEDEENLDSAKNNEKKINNSENKQKNTQKDNLNSVKSDKNNEGETDEEEK